MRREKRQKRIVFMVCFFFIMIAALAGRIFQLQMISGGRYAARAAAQRVGAYIYASGRGQILDRHREPLHTHWVDATEQVVNELTAQNLADFLPQGVILQENRYHAGSLATHVTGYIKKPRNPLQPQDGLAGLERVYNDELQGMPSAVGGVLDAHGRVITGLGLREWRYNHYRRPYNIITTIDSAIQAAVERAPIEKGAAVILDPQSGDILAMASYPRLPVEKLYQGMSQAEFAGVKEGNLFQNKAVLSYPPGSVFKVILAAAAIERDLREPEGNFICTGAYEVGNRRVRCYDDKAHGVVDLHEALAVSCNGYFVNLAQRLGKDAVLEMARRFKLGQSTRLPLGGEKAGRIPKPHKLTHPGDVANVSIGQGDVEVTPIQLARVMAMIANDGRDVYPRLVSGIIDKNGNTVQRFPVQIGARVLQPSVLQSLKPMLEDVVTAGTARGARLDSYLTAGKSGTAETNRAGISHSWFAGYVAAEGRVLVSVVFIEEWSKGDPTAATVYSRIMAEVLQLPGIPSQHQ